MTLTIGTAPVLAADAYVQGEQRRCIGIDEFRGSWLVVAFGARRSDLREFAAIADAFEGTGAVVVAAVPDDYHDVEAALADEPEVRFPVFTDIDERRRLTLILDPHGVVRHAGLRRSATETLNALETLRAGQRAVCPECGRGHDMVRAA